MTEATDVTLVEELGVCVAEVDDEVEEVLVGETVEVDGELVLAELVEVGSVDDEPAMHAHVRFVSMSRRLTVARISLLRYPVDRHTVKLRIRQPPFRVEHRYTSLPLVNSRVLHTSEFTSPAHSKE